MVAFSSRDNSGGSGVKNINFSLSGAQNSGAKVIPGNFATTIISAEGTTVVTFFATDRDGNQEKPKTITVRIDKGDPQISGMPQHACILSPANSQLIPVATVSAMDALSGISQGSFQVTAASNQSSGKGGPDVVITPLGNHGFRVFLRAENSGLGARIYTVTAKAIDLAGNSSLKTATCVVPPGKHGEHTGHDGDRSDSDEHDHNHDD
jgi:phage tail sheath protein FI